MAEQTGKPRRTILLLGDSITQWSLRPNGWGNLLAQHYMRRADVVNRGFSGYNSAWILHAAEKVRHGAMHLLRPSRSPGQSCRTAQIDLRTVASPFHSFVITSWQCCGQAHQLQASCLIPPASQVNQS